jgi:predicted TPR repeat methyltransferase
LAFTVERSVAPDEVARFRMGLHGRYVHAEGYVASALDAAGFRHCEITPAVLRVELGDDVQGMVVAARRPAQD